jgi:hypothetical protein
VHPRAPAQCAVRLAVVSACLWPSTSRRMLARLYAPMHCTNAHPCPSRSALVPLCLSATRPAVPPHMLSSPCPLAPYPRVVTTWVHAPDHSQPSTASDRVTRANPRAIAILSCVPSNLPARAASSPEPSAHKFSMGHSTAPLQFPSFLW